MCSHAGYGVTMGAFKPPSKRMKVTNRIAYRKGDMRRMLLVLGAIDAMPQATLLKVAMRTGLDKKTVSSLIRQAFEQAHVDIEKAGPEYTIISWGPVIKKGGARMALTGALNAPTVSVMEKSRGEHDDQDF